MAFGEEIMKAAASKALVIKINLAFLVFFLIFYLSLLLQPRSLYGQNAAAFVRCTLRGCHTKKVEERITREKIPSFMRGLPKNLSVALVNVAEEVMDEWDGVGRFWPVQFQRVPESFEWMDLFPEWIDEEEENEGPSCPEMPMPDLANYGEVDVVVGRLPCRWPEKGWARDVFRLQVHLVVAEVVARKGRRDEKGKVKVVLLSKCEPMMEIFRCEDVVREEGEWWLFEVGVEELEAKLALPVGSCKLAMPLWEEGTNKPYELATFTTPPNPRRREAYATVLHSSDAYVCGAITLAQSLLTSGTTRDLILLHDRSIPDPKLRALAAAGWKLVPIKRIRNPNAEPKTYNEYNYSKLRLWQLSWYHKIIFIDADIVVLRNLDLLFHFPEISAVGNDGSIFNSGIMVVRPSKCGFKRMMRRKKEVVSYNGGDQGFLNEVFVWWHRLPRRVNFLKNFWANTTAEAAVKNGLFAADPPALFAIHYLGLKPWLCYRDYDCNWNIGDQRVYASDEAHRRWWRVHDEMAAGLRRFCGLSERRKVELEWDCRKAAEMGFSDEHWKWNITDRRKVE